MTIIDTNVLIDYPRIVEEITDICLPIQVIEELDKLKTYKDAVLSSKARKASSYIYNNRSKITFDFKSSDLTYTDDIIIERANAYQCDIISNDINLLIKAEAAGLSARPHHAELVENNGLHQLTLDLDEYKQSPILNNIIETHQPPMKMYENEFLQITSTENDDCGLYQMKNGALRQISYAQSINNDINNKVTARNLEQKCLITLLNDPDISIILANGQYGVGKSYITVNYALQELQKGRINHIIYIPNNSAVENTRELGILPGDTSDKELAYMGSINDIVGRETLLRMIEEEELIIAPMSTIRGRNFEKSIVLVSEAQNLTTDHIKLLIGRCAQGTKIIFDGDIKQSDKNIFRQNNGIQLLSKLCNSPFDHLFGQIKLNKVERSLTAQAADYLDSI